MKGWKILTITTIFLMLVISSGIPTVMANNGRISGNNAINHENISNAATTYWDDTINVGSIYVDYRGPTVRCTPKDVKIDLGPYGGDLTVKVDYQLICKTGLTDLPDGAVAVIALIDSSKKGYDSAYTYDEKSGTLSFTIHDCKPGEMYKIALYANYTWATDPLGNSKYKKDEKISIVTIVVAPPDLDVDKNKIDISIHCDTTGTVFFHIKNVGREDSKLYWKFTGKTVDGEGTFYIYFGGGVPVNKNTVYGPLKGGESQKIEVDISSLPYVPPLQREKTTDCYLHFENADNPSDKVTVHIHVTVLRPRSKELNILSVVLERLLLQTTTLLKNREESHVISMPSTTNPSIATTPREYGSTPSTTNPAKKTTNPVIARLFETISEQINSYNSNVETTPSTTPNAQPNPSTTPSEAMQTEPADVSNTVSEEQ